MCERQKISIGDWIKMQRSELGLSQRDIVDASKGILKQSTISMYEQNKVKDINVGKLFKIASILGFMPKEIPWDLLDLDLLLERERVSVYELPNKVDSVKLFNGKVYNLEGFLGKEIETGQVKNITEIYYQVRSAVSEGKLYAKRKNPHDELIRLPQSQN